MRLIFTAIALLALSGCALTGVPKAGDPVLQQVLSDLQGCHREYQGALGVTPSFTFSIKCDPTVPTVAAPAPAGSLPAPGVVVTPLPSPAPVPAAPAGQLPPPATKPPGS